MPTTYAIPNGRTVMDATTYTGNGTSQSITNQYQFQPDLVWMKSRNNGYWHAIFDSVRGTTKGVASNTTDAEVTSSAGQDFTAFNSNGFGVGAPNNWSSPNANGSTTVAWQWKANAGTTSSNTNGSVTSTVSVNATAGFSIATCTTPASNGNFSVGHGLSVAPSFIIVKNRSSTNNWTIYHKSLGAGGGLLFTTAAYLANTDMWANTTPSTTVWTSNVPNWWSASQNLVAYSWAEVAGFSQFGSYTGNGSANGPFIYTGFKPKFLMYKRTDSAGGWFMVDSTRNPVNTANYWLNAAALDVEQTDDAIDLNSNGFKIRTTGTGTNASGGTYVYAVFAENPFKYANAR